MTSNQTSNRGSSTKKDVPLFIIGGPAGCGKSTIANSIAVKTHFPFIEGDNLHPPQNIAKMSSGHPLVDADRWDWLDKIISTSQNLEQTESPKGIIVTCSSLKKSYRDRLRRRIDEAREKGSRLREHFVFCNLSEEESLRRVRDRPGHYMKPDMVASQFRDLEVPKEDEERVFVLNVEKSIPEVNREVVEFVKSYISTGSDVNDMNELVESSA